MSPIETAMGNRRSSSSMSRALPSTGTQRPRNSHSARLAASIAAAMNAARPMTSRLVLMAAL